MATNQEYELFERDFGYRPCFKVWSHDHAGTHRCAKKEGHAEECVCHCGSRHFWPQPDAYEPRSQTEKRVETRRRPTIEELEKILQREPDAPIDIRPDGTVRMPQRLHPHN